MKLQGLIAIDLDGTLLDSQGQYSLATRDYLRQLTKRGYLVVLATGRPYRSVAPIYVDLGIDAPVICYNGALAFHPSDPTFSTFQARFPQRIVTQIVAENKDIVLRFMAESETTVYFDEPDSRLDRYFPYSGMNLRQGDLCQTIKEDVFTLLFRCDENEALGKRLLGHYPNIGWRAWSGGVYSELYVANADKGVALSYIMKQYGLKAKDVYAFGDASNDVEMLDVSGHPFAMKGNRCPEVLGRFPQTKNPVEEDGVMVALKELIG